MKKLLITFILITGTISSWSTIPLDTIPYWNIYYGKVILIQGNTSQTTTGSREIKIKKDIVWQLTITFNYDTRGPIESELEVKIGDKKLRTLKSQAEEGSFFIIPVAELIDTNMQGKRYEMEFYYSDNRGTKNLKLGTIIFIT